MLFIIKPSDNVRSLLFQNNPLKEVDEVFGLVTFCHAKEGLPILGAKFNFLNGMALGFFRRSFHD